MAAFLEYNAGLSALIYGGSDMFVMPSRFEPCGLGQMLSMRYGSVPIVRATGGLLDTVQDGINGFSFFDYSSGAFWNALERAMYSYHLHKDGWRSIQHNGMETDFSWRQSAQGYTQLYEWAKASTD
jgi:starch synthase